jgi:hypothetical protein
MSRFERWSRRKLDSQTLDDSDDVTIGGSLDESPVDGHEESAGYASASKPDAGEEQASVDPAPGSLDDTLPDPDTLPPGSDIKAFLEPGVSQGLRRRALRRLFSGDNYGIRDGLDDYDHDYREKLKPLASELAQRMRQWTRPVDAPEEDDGVDETQLETPKDSTTASLEDTAADQELDREVGNDRNPASDSADSGDADDVGDQSSTASLDEGRIGARHRIDQD